MSENVINKIRRPISFSKMHQFVADDKKISLFKSKRGLWRRKCLNNESVLYKKPDDVFDISAKQLDFIRNKNDQWIATFVEDVSETATCLSVLASGDHYFGPPEMEIWIDGNYVASEEIQAVHKHGEWEEFQYTLDKPPQKIIDIKFLRDAFGGSKEKDRNLLIQTVKINGGALDINQVNYRKDRPLDKDIWFCGDYINMHWSGTARFDLTHSEKKIYNTFLLDPLGITLLHRSFK